MWVRLVLGLRHLGRLRRMWAALGSYLRAIWEPGRQFFFHYLGWYFGIFSMGNIMLFFIHTRYLFSAYEQGVIVGGVGLVSSKGATVFAGGFQLGFACACGRKWKRCSEFQSRRNNPRRRKMPSLVKVKSITEMYFIVPANCPSFQINCSPSFRRQDLRDVSSEPHILNLGGMEIRAARRPLVLGRHERTCSLEVSGAWLP